MLYLPSCTSEQGSVINHSVHCVLVTKANWASLRTGQLFLYQVIFDCWHGLSDKLERVHPYIKGQLTLFTLLIMRMEFKTKRREVPRPIYLHFYSSEFYLEC